ncbi:hypothetical protein [Sporosarcina sp. OR05]|uniref:hypothetical protein n=1 Tax=Sporosarcina sp. OR05 TaxID=2969819 RepID=UPI00352B5455
MNIDSKDQVVEEIVHQIYEAYPWLVEKFGENGRKRTAEDNYHHLDHLEIAFQMNDAQFFIDYTKWLDGVLTSRNVSRALIVDNFQRLQHVLPGKLDSDRETAYLHYLAEALTILRQLDV